MDYKKHAPTVVFVLLIIITLFYGYKLVGGMEQLPSPLYGGDYYFQKGCIESVRESFNPLASCGVIGAHPIYMPLYSIFVTFVSLITFQGVFDAMILSSVLIMALSLLTFYALFRKFYSVHVSLLLLFVMVLATRLTFVFKYTEFTKLLAVPLLLWALFLFLEKKSYRNAIFLGVMWGINGWAHAITFITLSFCIVMFFILDYAYHWYKKKEIMKLVKKEYLYFLTFIVIAVVIATIFWFKPVFIDHGPSSLHYTQWNGDTPELNSIGAHLSYAKDLMTWAFFFESRIKWINWICNIFILFSIGLLFFSKPSKQIKHLVVFTLIGIVFMLHFMLTIPLFDFNFGPTFIPSLVFTPFKLLLFGYGLTFLYQKWPKLNYISYIVPVLFILILMHTVAFHQDNQYYKNGFSALSNQDVALSEYLKENTHVNDVILSTNEISFRVSALSGRKSVSSRRAHAGPFVNIDERNRDSAIMLYGNNPATVKTLLEKYDVKYVYWDAYWARSEFHINPQGQVMDTFDPLMTFAELGYQDEYDENNVSYTLLETWIDPAIRREEIPRFMMTVIGPDNYRTLEQPWSSALGNMLEPVYTTPGGAGVLYKVI